MKSDLLPRLPNPPFEDPLLLVEQRHRRQALLFDLGDLQRLSNRLLLRIDRVFVSHCHMDHCIGFDRLLRVILGRRRELHLYGPAELPERIAHRLQGYSWNLVGGYAEDLRLWVTGVEAARRRTTVFSMKAGFRALAEEALKATLDEAPLWQDARLTVEAALLEHHGLPVLAFRLAEARRVNVHKARLADLGLPTGPWLAQLKALVLAEADPHTLVSVPTAAGPRRWRLGELLSQGVVQVGPGMRLGYVVDCDPSEANRRRLVTLLRGVDWLFIETPFLRAEATLARRKGHLWAAFAGALARQAGVARVVPIHLSRRHEGDPQRLYEELREAAGPSVRCLWPGDVHLCQHPPR